MSNMKKMLDTQQRINEAARYIIDYFSNEMDYEVHLEQMLSAQTQIIGLMELSKAEAIVSHGDPVTSGSNEIVLFLHDVHHYLRMLKPFIELANQQKGGAS